MKVETKSVCYEEGRIIIDGIEYIPLSSNRENEREYKLMLRAHLRTLALIVLGEKGYTVNMGKGERLNADFLIDWSIANPTEE